jgi:hypothetical protein
VARAYYVNDSKDHAVVTDIGEGKSLDSRNLETSAGAGYGCREFRAPEVMAVKDGLPPQTSFPSGSCVAKSSSCELMSARPRSPPRCGRWPRLAWTGEEMVPQKFKKIAEGCLSREHTERPSMRSVIRDLDRLSGKFYYEEKGSIFVPYRASTD